MGKKTGLIGRNFGMNVSGSEKHEVLNFLLNTYFALFVYIQIWIMRTNFAE